MSTPVKQSKLNCKHHLQRLLIVQLYLSRDDYQNFKLRYTESTEDTLRGYQLSRIIRICVKKILKNCTSKIRRDTENLGRDKL